MFNFLCITYLHAEFLKGIVYQPEEKERKLVSQLILNDRETAKLETFCPRSHEQQSQRFGRTCWQNQRN